MRPEFLGALFAFQGLLIFADEFGFHRRRGLGLWERVGHPLDTISLMLPLAWALRVGEAAGGVDAIFWVLGGFSCLFVTKDEWVHSRECTPAEHWLHALLFMVHPLVVVGVGMTAGSAEARSWILLQLGLMAGFLGYQALAGIGVPGLRYGRR